MTHKSILALLVLIAFAPSCRRKGPASPMSSAPTHTRTPVSPSRTPTESATLTPSATESSTFTWSATPSPSRTPTETSTWSPSSTATPTFSDTRTSSPTFTQTPTPLMVDDLDDADLTTLQGQNWLATDDSGSGGSSTISIANLAGGAAATARFFRMTGTIHADIPDGTGLYYGFTQATAPLVGISPLNFSNVRMYLKGNTAVSLAASGLALSVLMADGDYFTLNVTADVTGAWTLGSYDLLTSTPDLAQIHDDFADETSDYAAIILYPIGYSLSAGPSGAYTIDMDQLEFFRP